jgi:hypothetical protein
MSTFTHTIGRSGGAIAKHYRGVLRMALTIEDFPSQPNKPQQINLGDGITGIGAKAQYM